MLVEKKVFTGQLDADSEASYVDKAACVNGENVRVGSTDAGVIGTVESIGGTLLASTPSPSVSFTEIGAVEDTPNNRILYFLYNNTTSHHKIICKEIITGNQYNVLLSSQVTGGLNFSKDHLIHSAQIIGPLLVWPNGAQNEPKCINIDAGIKTNHPSYDTNEDAYATPLKYETTTLIKRPPIYRLQATKVNDTSFDNDLIENESFQFTYRYKFKDNQKSALATFSKLIPFNAVAEDSNSIDVYLSYSEYIDDDVEKVDFCVRFGNNGKTAIVKTFTKNNATDLAAINAHNAGTSQLGFRFYNDIQGTFLGADEVIPFDGVPLYSLGMELARFRLFMGDYTSGYDTPDETSLSVTLTNVNTGATGSFAGTWGYVTLTGNYQTGVQSTVMFPFVRRTSDSTFYYFPSVRAQNPSAWNGGVGPVPSTINLSEATQAGVSEATLVAYLKATNYPPTTGAPVGTPPWLVPYSISYASLGSVTVLQFQPVSVNQFFKSNSTYLVNIAFYDRFRRKCGVLKNPVQVSIPIRTYAQTTFTTILQWALSNTNAVDEIPDWAYYYQIHITKNQTTRFFSQARVYDACYVEKGDPSDLNAPYVFGNNNFSSKTYAIAFDLKTLQRYGLGYSFQEGDFANIFFLNGEHYTLPVIDTYGTYVLLSPINFGFGLNADTSTLLELFTPYKSSLTEAYYETGEVFPISNPGTSNRAYSTLVGQINGDTYALLRTDKNGGLSPNEEYITEAMSPNDKKWKEWNTDTGWPNFILEIGQVAKTNSVIWTNTFVEGSKQNGINKVITAVQGSDGNIILSTNEKDLDNEVGALKKLKLAAKVQGELGTVMLAVCEKATVSMYLGETQQYGSSAQVSVSLSTQVIGSVNIMKGAYGTRHPETVCSDDRGNVFWWDIDNGKFIRYSNNGLYPISNEYMTRFWKLFSDQFNSMSAAEIEALGSRPFVFTAVDKHHSELLITIPKLLNTPPKGYLPDYPSTIYPFDIWDGQAKTLVYKFGNQAESQNNRWSFPYTFTPEGYITFGNRLYSFKAGQMYLHNQPSNPCEFYGVQHKSKIMFLANEASDAPKVYNAIRLQVNMLPTLTYLRSEDPITQASDLVDFDYRNNEGFFDATFYRNKLVPTATGMTTDGLLTAEKIRTTVLRVMLEFTISGTPLEFLQADIKYVESRGHRS